MRLAIDMQAAQTSSRHPNSARFATALAKAIVRKNRGHQVLLVLNGLLRESVDRIRADFRDLVPAENIRIWTAIGPTREVDPANRWRREASEKMREAFLLEQCVDVVLVMDHFVGFEEDAVGMVEPRKDAVPTAVILSDELLPVDRDQHGRASKAHVDWMRRKLRCLKRSNCLLAISGSGRQAAIAMLGVHPSDVLNIASDGGTSVEQFPLERLAANALTALEDLAHRSEDRISEKLNLERTSVFERRRLKILVLKLDHLGDFVLAIPAMAKLRARYPDAAIDAIVGSWNLELAQRLKVFTNVYAFDFFKKRSSERPSVNDPDWQNVLQRLGDYDIAVDLRRQHETRELLLLIKAELRVGYETLNSATDSRLDIALKAVADQRSRATWLNRIPTSKQILALIDCLPTNINDYIKLPEFSGGAFSEGSIAIFPRAGSEVREWGHARFEDLVDRLTHHPLVREIAIYFSEEADARGFRFKYDEKVKIRSGLGFSQLIEVLQTHSVCVANNSGGAHLAAMLGLCAIGVYSGHELASEWGPQLNEAYTIHRDATCAPCHLGKRSECRHGNFCLEDISVEDVFQTVLSAVRQRGGRREEISEDARREFVRVRKNTNTIVRQLIQSVAPIAMDATETERRQVAMAVASNHPGYSGSSASGIVTLGRKLDHGTSLLDWHGFSGDEERFRWTDGTHAAIDFFCSFPDAIPAVGVVTLVFHTNGRQRIGVELNGVKISETAEEGRNRTLRLRVLNLRAGRNRLDFELPGATSRGQGDFRKLGIALRSFRLDVESGEGASLDPGSRRERVWFLDRRQQ